MRPRSRLLRRLLVGALLCAALAACSEQGSPDDPASERIRRFKATHLECNPRFYRQACQIGPDGKLYEYNPGEQDSQKRK